MKSVGLAPIELAPKDGSPVWAKVCTLHGNVFRTWIYWSSETEKWAYAPPHTIFHAMFAAGSPPFGVAHYCHD